MTCLDEIDVDDIKSLGIQDRNVISFILDKARLYSGKSSFKEVLYRSIRNFISLNFGSSINNIYEYILSKKLTYGQITIILTNDYKRKILEDKIDCSATLKHLDNNFLKIVKEKYGFLLNIRKVFFQNIENDLFDVNVYNFDIFLDFVGERMNERDIDDHYNECVSFLNNIYILSTENFVMRSLARAIIYYKESYYNKDLIKYNIKKHNEHKIERVCFLDFLYSISLSKDIERLRKVSVLSYEKDHTILRKLLSISNKINKYSAHINIAYVSAIMGIFFSRTYFEYVGEDISNTLTTKYNITIYNDKNLSEYYGNMYGGIINGLVSFPTTILALIQIISSLPSMIFSFHKANYIIDKINGIDCRKRIFDSYSIPIIFRWSSNIGLQFVDISSHPLKNSLMKMTIYRFFVPFSIIEEYTKVIKIKNCLIRSYSATDKNEKKIPLYAKTLYSLSFISLFMEYYVAYDFFKNSDNSMNKNQLLKIFLMFIIKSGRTLALVIPYSMEPKITFNHHYEEFFCNSFIRNFSSLFIIPIFEYVKSLRYISLLTAIDVLLTSNSDRISGESMGLIVNEYVNDRVKDKLIEDFRVVRKDIDIKKQQDTITDNKIEEIDENLQNAITSKTGVLSGEERSHLLTEVKVQEWENEIRQYITTV